MAYILKVYTCVHIYFTAKLSPHSPRSHGGNNTPLMIRTPWDDFYRESERKAKAGSEGPRLAVCMPRCPVPGREQQRR